MIIVFFTVVTHKHMPCTDQVHCLLFDKTLFKRIWLTDTPTKPLPNHYQTNTRQYIPTPPTSATPEICLRAPTAVWSDGTPHPATQLNPVTESRPTDFGVGRDASICGRIRLVHQASFGNDPKGWSSRSTMSRCVRGYSHVGKVIQIAVNPAPVPLRSGIALLITNTLPHTTVQSYA